MFQEELAVTEVETRGGITLPKGFRAVGLHCGVKKTKKDLALIVSDVPAVGAAVFTLNKVQAAPVVLSKQHLAVRKTFRAIIVNSGNANACTGEGGYDDACTMADVTAAVLGVYPSEVFVASTGVIGEPLPIEKILRGIQLAAGQLDEGEHESAAEAIMTTDTFKKVATATFEIDGKTVNIGGIAKGSGMIHPNMATMLGFVTTDAAFDPEVLQSLVKTAADKTFNRIVVDGDTSTNDMLVALANGESGIEPLEPGSEAYTIFASNLERVLKQLAIDIVRDGEGATKLVEIHVDGAWSEHDAVKAAKAIALSPLVKTAIHGEDANWGRIMAAVGYSGIEFDPARLEIEINNASILGPNYTVMLPNSEANKSLKGDFVELVVKLNCAEGNAIVWTCDFSEQYVVINGSYRS
ncbi:MAG: bifunctional glutamate N-acetyltransferase/amino-acid acetyltransferase ArgJ [Ignavibacteriae bacterium]|nr:bifunctional glutamate N-acetyltransferase/amino-acid acetyltransferase ArgJ [Ignavibacteriota bacterium]